MLAERICFFELHQDQQMRRLSLAHFQMLTNTKTKPEIARYRLERCRSIVSRM